MLLAAAATQTVSGWSVLGIISVNLIIAAVCFGGMFVVTGSFLRRADRREGVRREYLNAKRQIDDVISDAKIRMEEVAGVRRVGERRMSDSFGSWREWL